MNRADILIVGGGPAGLTAAIAARVKGLEVTVIDAARPPIDKACGEAILPGGVEVLRRIGVQLSDSDAFPLQGIRFVGDGVSAEARFQSRCGLALRRTRLHQILAARASELGIRMLWGTRATDADLLVPGRWVVGADGVNSRVRHRAGLDAVRYESRRYGFRRHYQVSPWSDLVEVHWGPDCQIYVTPVSHDEVGVALLAKDRHLRLDSALEKFPELQRRLARARETSTERGAVTVSRRLRRVFRGNTVLIGDASGSVDAITGEGMSLSFQQAIALSEALCSGDLRTYQAAHSRLARRPAFVGRLLLSLDRFPWLRQAVLRMLAFDPPIFARLLDGHAAIVP